MQASALRRALQAAATTAGALGLRVDDAVVIQNSGRIAARLIPCDVLARIGPSADRAGFQFEVDVARRLQEVGGPVGKLEPEADPCVYIRDGFAITLWTYFEPAAPFEIPPAEYADALVRLHACLRKIDLEARHLSDRIALCLEELGDRELSPELPDEGRELLRNALSEVGPAFTVRGAGEQLLHGEPHPGNVLSTREGPLFIDLGGCCRGPVEFDLVHAPAEVAHHYPGVNPDLIHECRILMWVLLTTCRWGRDDQLPNREYWRVEGLNRLRAALVR